MKWSQSVPVEKGRVPGANKNGRFFAGVSLLFRPSVFHFHRHDVVAITFWELSVSSLCPLALTFEFGDLKLGTANRHRE